jgi:hypothetical protein
MEEYQKWMEKNGEYQKWMEKNGESSQISLELPETS